MDALRCMRLALEEAWKYQGLTYPNPAVGCTVATEQGAVLAVEAHRRAGGPHAEVLALKTAYRVLSGDSAIDELEESHAIHDYLLEHHNGLFHNTIVYVTLEPCSHTGRTPACAGLLARLKPAKVVIAQRDLHGDGPGGIAMLEAAGITVETGVCAEEGAALLLPFERWRQGRFILFKWAQTLDGHVDGGVISCQTSRKAVHGMRDRCDLLVIGGNTVRTDRPTLDARMVEGKAPDVLIYSRGDDFDRTIPLFNVPGRTVHIAPDFTLLEQYENIFIEGGPGMFEASKSVTDCYLAFIAPKSGGTIAFTNGTAGYSVLHSRRIGDDLMVWLKGN